MKSISTATAGLALMAGAALAVAQDPQVPEATDPKIEATVERLGEVWPDRNAPFTEAVTDVVRYLVTFTEHPLHPTDHERLALTFTQVLGRGEVRQPEVGNDTYRAAMEGLGNLGELGAKQLIQLHDDGRFPVKPEYRPLRAALVEAIGATGVSSAAEYLVKVVRSAGEDPILLAAGRAALHFADAPREVRAPLVEVLARRLAGFENLANRRPSDPERHRDLEAEDARQTLAALDGSWRATLQALTGVQQPNGQEWWDWYQEHDDEEWPRDEAARAADGAEGDGAVGRRR